MGFGQQVLTPHWQGCLSDYVTGLAWSPDSQILAITTSAGEMMLWQRESLSVLPLMVVKDQTLDCLGFSTEGQYLAAGGQGRIWIWDLSQPGLLAAELNLGNVWVDRLSWHPYSPQLAFSVGKYVQVWNAITQDIEVTLPFEASSVLDLTWHPHGHGLTVAGYQGVKIWNVADWDEDPYVIEIPSATLAVSWSPEGRFLASGNLDRTIILTEWGNPDPWAMTGFPGKVRQLIWSDQLTSAQAPLLVALAAENLVVWHKEQSEAAGWVAEPLSVHEATVRAAAFQPGSFLLASAGSDGCLYLWTKVGVLGQMLEGVEQGFSCLSWDPQGHFLAAGGEAGEILIWTQTSSGKGFGRSNREHKGLRSRRN